MKSITDTFKTLRQSDRCALIPFLTAGDPDLTTTAQALELLDQKGADLIEIGVPYSDPLADGPIIQAAATRALQHGTHLESVLEVVAAVSPKIQAPLILFTYYNPILKRGIKPFLDQIALAGIKGLVIPDLPAEEAQLLLKLAKDRGIKVILLIAPTSSPQRIEAIAHLSQGFIYLVSVTGVTGVRSQLQGRVKKLLHQIRQITDKPIGVGFGISTPAQARQVHEWGADAVIVGSAFVQRLANGTPNEGLQAISTFCQDLKVGLEINPLTPSTKIGSINNG